MVYSCSSAVLMLETTFLSVNMLLPSRQHVWCFPRMSWTWAPKSTRKSLVYWLHTDKSIVNCLRLGPNPLLSLRAPCSWIGIHQPIQASLPCPYVLTSFASRPRLTDAHKSITTGLLVQINKINTASVRPDGADVFSTIQTALREIETSLVDMKVVRM